MMKPFKIYSPQSFQTLPWRNGLGSTVELLAETPNKNEAFSWRLSIASVANDGPFSDFSGYDRTLLLLEGSGITLNKPNGIFKVLNSSLDYANFKGEDLIDATLHNGPIKDFNIMTLRSICTSSVTAIDETSESLLNINADKLLVYSIKPVNIQIGLEASISLEANHLLQFNYYINNTMILDKTQAIVIQINYKK
ncbi:HutD family protein [Candidatus Pseudothioglobus sp. Uisw_041]|jgi:environmental stress-induced protein Ves|uniref:HutD/Ves family protein n=1 Tax=Candidatus Pseudothioglobus sp. Uisw_041 TaxID=3230996 RepID=UPI003A89DC36